MTPRDFCYWLQGYFEINGKTKEGRKPKPLETGEVECIKNHLGMVFHHIDKTFGDQEHQDELKDIHCKPEAHPVRGSRDIKFNC